MADKRLAQERLETFGLATPRSAVVDQSCRHCAGDLVGALPSQMYWYLRFDERLVPSLPRVAHREALEGLLAGAFAANEALSVIVQQRVTARTSGVTAVLDDRLFLESIHGELRALLRLGVTPSRTLVSRDGQVLAAELNTQEFQCAWEGLDYISDLPTVEGQTLSPDVVRQMTQATAALPAPCLLEWVEQPDGELVFLDYRLLSASFLAGGDALQDSFANGAYWTLVGGAATDLWDFERPLYDLGPTVLDAGRPLRFTGGGALAHLCVYAADRGLACEVRRPGRGA